MDVMLVTGFLPARRMWLCREAHASQGVYGSVVVIGAMRYNAGLPIIQRGFNIELN